MPATPSPSVPPKSVWKSGSAAPEKILSSLRFVFVLAGDSVDGGDTLKKLTLRIREDSSGLILESTSRLVRFSSQGVILVGTATGGGARYFPLKVAGGTAAQSSADASAADATDSASILALPALLVEGWTETRAMGVLTVTRRQVSLDTLDYQGRGEETWVIRETVGDGTAPLSTGDYWYGASGLLRVEQAWTGFDWRSENGAVPAKADGWRSRRNRIAPHRGQALTMARIRHRLPRSGTGLRERLPHRSAYRRHSRRILRGPGGRERRGQELIHPHAPGAASAHARHGLAVRGKRGKPRLRAAASVTCRSRWISPIAPAPMISSCCIPASPAWIAARRRADLEGYLDAFGLELTGKPIRAYSKGMKQRLALAIAMLDCGRLLILDEPNSGLDPVGIAMLRAKLDALKASGTTLLISTHRLAEVMHLADQVLVLHKGQGGGREPHVGIPGLRRLRKVFPGPGEMRVE